MGSGGRGGCRISVKTNFKSLWSKYVTHSISKFTKNLLFSNPIEICLYSWIKAWLLAICTGNPIFCFSHINSALVSSVLGNLFFNFLPSVMLSFPHAYLSSCCFFHLEFCIFKLFSSWKTRDNLWRWSLVAEPSPYLQSTMDCSALCALIVCFYSCQWQLYISCLETLISLSEYIPILLTSEKSRLHSNSKG